MGHLIVDSLASRLGISMTSDRAMGGIVGRTTTTLGDDLVSVTLFKPSECIYFIQRYFDINVVRPTETYMNISGGPRQTVRSCSSMIVIHDSISRRSEELSYKLGGSANGNICTGADTDFIGCTSVLATTT